MNEYKGYPVYENEYSDADVRVIKAEDVGREIFDAEVKDFRLNPEHFDGESKQGDPAVVAVWNTPLGIELYVGKWYEDVNQALATDGEGPGYLVTLSEREAKAVIEALEAFVAAEATV